MYTLEYIIHELNQESLHNLNKPLHISLDLNYRIPPMKSKGSKNIVV